MLLKIYSRIGWIYSASIQLPKRNCYTQIAVEKRTSNIFLGLKVKGGDNNLQKYLKRSFLIINWLEVTSICQIITIKGIFTSNLVFIYP